MRGRDAAAFYTRYAHLYDRLATDAPFVTGLREHVVDALDPARGDVVVEMGCGTGANLPYLRERVGRGGTVIGLDVSAGVLGRARERIERAGWGNVHVARADATRPPLRAPTDALDGSGRNVSDIDGRNVSDIDAVLATFLTGMLADPEGAVDEWCRLVADGDPSDRGEAAAVSGGRSGGGRICVAGLARSTEPIGRLLNPAFAAAVRLAAPPGGGDGLPRARRERSGAESAVARLDRRAVAAHGRVHERCRDASTTRLLGGFARITAGSVDGS